VIPVLELMVVEQAAQLFQGCGTPDIAVCPQMEHPAERDNYENVRLNFPQSIAEQMVALHL
jgi:hypothetical protein